MFILISVEKTVQVLMHYVISNIKAIKEIKTKQKNKKFF